MKTIPLKYKYEKSQKGSIKHKISTNTQYLNRINYGNILVIVKTYYKLTSKQLETTKNYLQKNLKLIAKIKFNCFTHIPWTKKPLEIRMGKGKGPVNNWITKLYPGFIFCEIMTKNINKTIITLGNLKAITPFKFIISKE